MYSIKKYIELSNLAKNFNYGNILDNLKKDFNYLYDKDELDYIALNLQICVKKSKPMYIHGYVLSSILNNFLINSTLDHINIIETGTARGFSSIIMAKILDKFNISGNIYTIDHNNIFNNCLKASQLKRSVSTEECINEWKNLANKYINFILGKTKKHVNLLCSKIDRFHFAFLDGSHLYEDVKFELSNIEKKQKSGDIIVCDDYTKKQYPGLCKAIDEFLEKGLYEYKIYYGDDGTKKRGYVYIKKK